MNHYFNLIVFIARINIISYHRRLILKENTRAAGRSIVDSDGLIINKVNVTT